MALTFNGSSSQLVGANIVTGYPFSMFAWIRPNSLTTDQMVMGVGDFGGSTEAAMFAAGTLSGDPLRAFSRNTSGGSTSASSSGMALSTWMPCLVVFRAANSRTVYLANNAPASSTASNTLGFANFDRFTIGVRAISATMYANMDIAHAAVWDEELTATDWLHLKYGTYPNDVRPWALVDYWSLDSTASTQTGVNGTVLTATDTSTAGTSPTMEQTIPDTEPLHVDGVWTWFTEPRAVEHSGSTYFGWVNSVGDVGVTRYVHATGIRQNQVLADRLEVDDHDNASIYVRPDGRLIAFYSKHNDSAGLRYRISDTAGEIGSWSSEAYIDAGNNVAYSNPRYLSALDRLYVHYRTNATDQYFVYSDDDGSTWSSPILLFDDSQPYVKSISNGVDRIDFFLTRNQPVSATTSVFHCYALVVGGVLKFYTSDGGTELTLPIAPTSCTTVYDASVSGVSAWPWDAIYGADGHPRVVYSRGVSSSDQRYEFARWTGSAWTTPVEVTTGGASLYASEPYYAYGIAFGSDENTLFIAIEGSGVGEIQEWSSADNGATWSKAEDVTASSSVKNARPYSPRGGSVVDVLWWGGSYTSFTSFNTNIYARLTPYVPTLPMLGTVSATAITSSGFRPSVTYTY